MELDIHSFLGNEQSYKFKDIRVFSNGEIKDFDENKILTSLINETNISERDAVRITRDVMERIVLSKISIISPRMIRGMVLSLLIEKGMMDIHDQYTTIGIPSFDIHNLIRYGDRENANICHNPQSVHGKISDVIMKSYTKKRLLPREVLLAHEKCQIHIHKMEFFDLGMFCQAWDPRMILLYGLPPTKKLKNYKYSKSTSDMRTACLHLANWFSYAQAVFSGGQGFLGFNTIMAPYSRKSTDYELTKSIRSFVFQVNQQRDSRGHQLPFTSIDLNLGIDPNFKDCHAVFDGEFQSETYSDYEDESLRILNKLVEIYRSGDGNNVPFSFPKFEIKVTNEKIEKNRDTWEKIVELVAHNGSPYIMNGNLLPETAQCQCCRIIFNPDGSIVKYCVDPIKFRPTDTHFPSFGSYQPVSINMPRVSIDANFDIDRCFDILFELLDLILITFKQKKDIIMKNKENKFPNIYWINIGDKDTEETLIDLDLQSMTLGFVGLNEMIENLIGKDISTDEGHELGKKFLKFLDKWCQETSIKEKMMINLWEQPAESTAHRFAKYDWKHYKDLGISIQGNDDSVYYTNSCHIPYSYDVLLHKRLVMQGDYHPIVKGGVISHIWLGEKPETGSLMSLIDKILNKTTNYYFSFSRDFTICNECGKLSDGLSLVCKHCSSSNLDYLSRITGYYALFSNYNDGKKKEFLDRRRERISLIE